MSAHPKDPRSYSIREAAELSGLPASTLRQYETIGLMHSIDRDASSRHRRYSDDDIDHAIAVACLNATGMSIEDMRAYLAKLGQGARSAGDQVDLLESHKQRLEREAHSLRLRQRYIDVKIAYWHAVAAGDTTQAQATAERAREIHDELRASQDHAAAHTPNPPEHQARSPRSAPDKGTAVWGTGPLRSD